MAGPGSQGGEGTAWRAFVHMQTRQRQWGTHWWGGPVSPAGGMVWDLWGTGWGSFMLCISASLSVGVVVGCPGSPLRWREGAKLQ